MTRWKYDISYRHPIYSALKKPSFRLGCKQGVACCACCSALMTTQLILGIMNPLVMVVVAIVIAAEKLLSTTWNYRSRQWRCRRCCRHYNDCSMGHSYLHL